MRGSLLEATTAKRNNIQRPLRSPLHTTVRSVARASGTYIRGYNFAVASATALRKASRKKISAVT